MYRVLSWACCIIIALVACAILAAPVVDDPLPMEDPVQQEFSPPDLRVRWNGGLILTYSTDGEVAAGPVLDLDPYVAYALCHKGPSEPFVVEFAYCWPGVDTSEYVIWGCFQSRENAMAIYLCLRWDVDGNGTVDLRDFAVFQREAKGW